MYARCYTDSKDAGYYTQLTWQTPHTSMSSLLLLAASFQNGLAVFHVGLPVIADTAKGEFRPLPEPNQSTIMTQTPSISPLCVKRWQGRHDRSFASWLSLGSHSSICLAILLHVNETDGGSAHLALVSMRIPLHRRGPSPKERLLPLDVMVRLTIPKDSASFPY